MRLYDKYRPKNLTEIVGQPIPLKIATTLVANPYSCCLMFEGRGGTGKTATAFAVAAELGCVDDWSGLDVIPATDLNIDRAKDVFGRSLRLKPMGGNGYRVIIIEELEIVVSANVQSFLKTALDTALPPNCIVIATTNGGGKLDKALIQRFKLLSFSSDQTFAMACRRRLSEIWTLETEGQPEPGSMKLWGWDDKTFSLRSALQQMEVFIECHAESVCGVS